VISGGAAAMQGVASSQRTCSEPESGSGLRPENIGGLSDSVDAPRFATVVVSPSTVRIARPPASHRAADRAFAGVGVDRFTRRIKSWLEDFF